MKSFILLSLPSLFTSVNIYGQASIPIITVSEKWIAFSPIILFLVILFLVFMKLRKDNVSLKDLLLDKDANIQIEVERTKQFVAISSASFENQQALQKGLDAINNNDPDTPKANTSISRFLAFLSGLISVGLACVITTFFMWNYFEDSKNTPDLDKLLTILLTLGIGVIPYAFNKVSTVLK